MDAFLLLGPTGVGKTPLGDLLAADGLLGRRCLHFDFGAALRAAAETPAAVSGLDPAVREVIRTVLDEGRLLEDHEFPIAAALLQGFLDAQGARPNDWLLLNGLPRHAGQAREIDSLHAIRAVLQLTAPHEVLYERIARDTGGDRAGRTDDDRGRITARIERYEARSAPLVEHYERRGAACLEVEIGVDTGASDTARRVASGLREADLDSSSGAR